MTNSKRGYMAKTCGILTALFIFIEQFWTDKDFFSVNLIIGKALIQSSSPFEMLPIQMDGGNFLCMMYNMTVHNV